MTRQGLALSLSGVEAETQPRLFIWALDGHGTNRCKLRLHRDWKAASGRQRNSVKLCAVGYEMLSAAHV